MTGEGGAGAISRGSSGCCAADGILAIAGDVGGGVGKTGISGSVATCPERVRGSIGAVGEDATSIDVGRAGRRATEGNEPV
jgi:hypothetical protein